VKNKKLVGIMAEGDFVDVSQRLIDEHTANRYGSWNPSDSYLNTIFPHEARERRFRYENLIFLALCVRWTFA